mmetsp:Transcript_15094/g.43633  ORF Transcript_15094/g.43633 Transcript_15094/m.43633 type:complete len:111 (+) Transcript_15094:81-413(+)
MGRTKSFGQHKPANDVDGDKRHARLPKAPKIVWEFEVKAGSRHKRRWLRTCPAFPRLLHSGANYAWSDDGGIAVSIPEEQMLANTLAEGVSVGEAQVMHSGGGVGLTLHH